MNSSDPRASSPHQHDPHDRRPCAIPASGSHGDLCARSGASTRSARERVAAVLARGRSSWHPVGTFGPSAGGRKRDLGWTGCLKATKGVFAMSLSDSPTTSGVSTRRRVLVECDDPTIQDGLARVLDESGYEVSVCAGPASRTAGCPLVAGGHCGLVENAQVVVHALDPAVLPNREVLAALGVGCPDTPIIVEAGFASGDEPPNVRRVRFPVSRAALLDAVRPGTS